MAANTAHSSARIWLHATRTDLRAPVQFLADEMGNLRDAPAYVVTDVASCEFSLSDLGRVEAFIREHNIAMWGLAGDALPLKAIERAHAMGVGLVLVQANVPKPCHGGWLQQRQLASSLARFEVIHTVTEEAAASLRKVTKGMVRIKSSGALARFAPAPPCNMQELSALKDMIGARPVWMMHQAAAEEVDAALLAHAHALRRAHRLVLLLQPRDITSGADLAKRAKDIGLTTARRSLDETIEETTQVYIADEDDDAGLFLRLSAVAVLGGSLTPNAETPSPLIAAALGSALIFGPHAGQETQRLLDQLHERGGGRQIEGLSQLGPAVSDFIGPEVGANAALQAWTFASQGADVTVELATELRDAMILKRGEP